MRELKVLAQDIMDAYYQDFTDDNEAFFALDYFMRAAQDSLAALRDEEYIERYKLLRQQNLHLTTLITFDQDWLNAERLTIKEDKESGYFVAEMKGKVASFIFDESMVGLQMVRPVKRGECRLVRSSVSQINMDHHLPKTEITFWWPGPDNKIYFDKDCCKEVWVDFVPSLDDNMKIGEGKAEAIKRRVLAFMLEAKNGTITNTTNDSNPITTVQTETNKDTAK